MMGNFEKLVVLTVLFLSAIVLAVSLNQGGEVEAGGDSPMGAALEHLGQDGPPGDAAPAPREGAGAPAADAERSGAGSVPLLHMGEDGAAAREAQATSHLPAADDQGRPRILKTTAGLESAWLDDFMVYTVAPGDTWSGLAQRFYQSGAHVHHLRAHNEELDELIEGERILVPIYDFTEGAGERAPFRPLERRAASSEPSRDGNTPAPSSGTAAVPGSVYTVVEGDNLSKISKKVYGTPNRWEDIYRANRDVLDSPDWLDLGMKLEIPR